MESTHSIRLHGVAPELKSDVIYYSHKSNPVEALQPVKVGLKKKTQDFLDPSQLTFPLAGSVRIPVKSLHRTTVKFIAVDNGPCA